jgi:hypothetical protein
LICKIITLKSQASKLLKSKSHTPKSPEGDLTPKSPEGDLTPKSPEGDLLRCAGIFYSRREITPPLGATLYTQIGISSMKENGRLCMVKYNIY